MFQRICRLLATTDTLLLLYATLQRTSMIKSTVCQTEPINPGCRRRTTRWCYLTNLQIQAISDRRPIRDITQRSTRKHRVSKPCEHHGCNRESNAEHIVSTQCEHIYFQNNAKHIFHVKSANSINVVEFALISKENKRIQSNKWMSQKSNN